MSQPKSFKKLRLHVETLSSVSTAEGTITVGGGGSSHQACTVLSTCSPECCATANAHR